MKQFLLDPEQTAKMYPKLEIKAGDLLCLPSIVLTFSEVEIIQAIALAKVALPSGVEVDILKENSPHLVTFKDEEKPFQFVIVKRESRPATSEEAQAIIESMKQAPNTPLQ